MLLHYECRVISSCPNIRLGFEWLTVANTPAYSNVTYMKKWLESRINPNLLLKSFRKGIRNNNSVTTKIIKRDILISQSKLLVLDLMFK
jgi:hypothetical protein